MSINDVPRLLERLLEDGMVEKVADDTFRLTPLAFRFDYTPEGGKRIKKAGVTNG